MERVAETVRNDAGPTGLLAWILWAADGIAASELADDRDRIPEPSRAA